MVKNGKFSNSRADYSDSSGPINSIIELNRALVVIYILTKFGDDWLIFVDARVLTSKLWMDGWMVSDHNSSLSTLCSGELKILCSQLLEHIFFLQTVIALLKTIKHCTQQDFKTILKLKDKLKI